MTVLNITDTVHKAEHQGKTLHVTDSGILNEVHDEKRKALYNTKG